MVSLRVTTLRLNREKLRKISPYGHFQSIWIIMNKCKNIIYLYIFNMHKMLNKKKLSAILFQKRYKFIFHHIIAKNGGNDNIIQDLIR